MEYTEEFGQLFLYHVRQEDLKYFTYPDGVKHISIKGDFLDTYNIPDGVETFVCNRLGLKELYVPDSVTHLYCSENLLQELSVPCTIEYLVVDGNQIHTLEFRDGQPEKLQVMEVQCNRLTNFDFEIPDDCDIDINDNMPESISQSIKRCMQDEERYLPKIFVRSDVY